MQLNFYRESDFSLERFYTLYTSLYDALYFGAIPEDNSRLDYSLGLMQTDPQLFALYRDFACDVPFSDRELNAWALTCQTLEGEWKTYNN